VAVATVVISRRERESECPNCVWHLGNLHWQGKECQDASLENVIPINVDQRTSCNYRPQGQLPFSSLLSWPVCYHIFSSCAIHIQSNRGRPQNFS